MPRESLEDSMTKRIPQVGDLVTTIYNPTKLAIVTNVRWLPIVHDYGLKFQFLEDSKWGMQPLKYVNLL